MRRMLVYLCVCVCVCLYVYLCVCVCVCVCIRAKSTRQTFRPIWGYSLNEVQIYLALFFVLYVNRKSIFTNYKI